MNNNYRHNLEKSPNIFKWFVAGLIAVIAIGWIVYACQEARRQRAAVREVVDTLKAKGWPKDAIHVNPVWIDDNLDTSDHRRREILKSYIERKIKEGNHE